MRADRGAFADAGATEFLRVVACPKRRVAHTMGAIARSGSRTGFTARPLALGVLAWRETR